MIYCRSKGLSRGTVYVQAEMLLLVKWAVTELDSGSESVGQSYPLLDTRERSKEGTQLVYV